MSNKTVDLQHLALNKLARSKSLGEWGRKHASVEKAIKTLSPADVAEGALLELVRRLNQAIRAMANDGDLDDEDKYDHNKRPSHAALTPDINIGDVLYSCDELDSGYSRSVVITKDEDGCVRTAYLDDKPGEEPPDGGRVYLHFNTGSLATTAAECVAREARNDVAYHGPGLRRAEAVLVAIRDGQPFDHLLGDIGDLPQFGQP